MLALGDDRSRVEHLRDRLVVYGDVRCIVVESASLEDDDVLEAWQCLAAPEGVDWVRPEACS